MYKVLADGVKDIATNDKVSAQAVSNAFDEFQSGVVRAAFKMYLGKVSMKGTPELKAVVKALQRPTAEA